MIRPRSILGLGLLAALAVLAVALLQREPRRTIAGTRTMGIATAVSPRSSHFGDPVSAQVTLLFDPRRVDARTIRLDTLFRPYEQIGEPVVARRNVGGLVRARYLYRLECLTGSCLPGAAGREFALPTLRVFYTLTDLRQRAADTHEWPPFEVAPRVGPLAAQDATWRANLDPPPVTYRIDPGTLGWLLAGAAAVLALGAAALAAGLLAGRAPAVEPVPAVPAPPLERALQGVRRAFVDGAAAEQRRALETLARELGRADREELADRARRLAWSPERPRRAAVDALARDVAEEGE